MYQRKTHNEFFIYCRNSFNHGFYPLLFDFKTEEQCDKKLNELNTRRDEALKDPGFHPFGWQSSYKKVKKHIKNKIL